MIILSSVVGAKYKYTIKQYIQDYFSEYYQENSDSARKIVINDTERNDEIWVLHKKISECDFFDNMIQKCDTPYKVETRERYYITLTSDLNNICYICITKNGEMFFGRYADADKANYCEYLVIDYENLLYQLSQVCQINAEGYINQNPIVNVPQCSDWAQSIVRKGVSLSFIPDYLLNEPFNEYSTRIDFCRMAYRMLNQKKQIVSVETTHPFLDVDTDESELAYLYNNGIIQGKSDTEFYPNDLISREEAATILDRLFKFVYKTDKSDLKNDRIYVDDNVISNWAKKSIYSMKFYQIMIGVDDDLFLPKTPFSLEQVVATLVRIYEYE